MSPGKLKIGLSTRSIEPGLTKSNDGMVTYTRALFDQLPRQGVEVKGIVFPPTKSTPPELRNSTYLRHSFPMCTIGQMSGIIGPEKLNLDLFHCTDHHAFRTSCPSVITIHDAVPLTHPKWMSGRLRAARNYVIKHTLSKGDAFIAVSKFATKEIIEAFDIPAGRISVVPNGVGEEWFAAVDETKKQETLQKYGIGSGYLLFVGTFQPRKNINRLLDAYASLPSNFRKDHPLVLVGRNGWRSEQTVARIRQLVRDGEPIHWLNQVHSTEDLRVLYQQAVALVFPSLHEGFGIPVLEAYASGTPVVTSKVSALPEVAGDAAILVNPLDSGEIAEGILEIIQNVSQRNQCIVQGRKRAQRFTWRKTAEMTLNVYKKLLGSSN